MKIHLLCREDVIPDQWGSVESAALLAMLTAIKNGGHKLCENPADADIIHIWREGFSLRKKSEQLINKFAGSKKIIVEAFGSHIISAWDMHNADRIMRKENVKKFDKQEADIAENFLIRNADIFRVPSLISKMSYIFDPDAVSNIVVRPFGYNETSFNTIITKKSCKRELLETTEVFVVGFFGRFRYRRGFHNFVDIAQEISSRNNNIVFVAAGDDRGAFEYLDKKVQKKGLILTGSPRTINNMADFMRCTDIVVAPSIESGFSLSTLEAMACGCYPIVSSNVGLAYLLLENAVGNIVTANDNNLFMQHILSCYNTWTKNRILFNKLQNKTSDVAKRYTWHRYVEELIYDYDRVMTLDI